MASSRYGTNQSPYTISMGDTTGANVSGTAGSSKIQQTQRQVDAVTNVMRENMAKVLERDARLNEMDDRADELQMGAQQFQTTAQKVKRKFWWKNIKMWIILISVLLVVVAIIAVAIYFSVKSDSPTNPTTPKP